MKHKTTLEPGRKTYPSITVALGRDQTCSTHFHKYIEILYVTKGEKKVTINNRTYVLCADNVCIADSYFLHGYEPSDGEQILTTLGGELCERYFQYRGNRYLAEVAITNAAYCRERILPFLNLLANRRSADRYCVQATTDMLLSNLCSELGLKEYEEPFEFDRADAVLAYIEENFEQDVTLTSLAEHFGYSKYYFSRLFNMRFHTGINDYLGVIRLEKTFRYLRLHKCNVATAALNCGFNSMPTFYRVLKKNHGELALKQAAKQPTRAK